METTMLLKFVQLVFPLIVSGAFCFGFRMTAKTFNWPSFSAQSLSCKLDEVSLKLLLPTFILLPILEGKLSANTFVNVLVGLSLPFVTLFIAILMSRLSQHYQLKPLSQSLICAASTYGGGNRGMLVCILFLGGTSNYSEIMTHFLFLDLGHTLFMVFFAPMVFSRLLTDRRQSGSSSLKQKYQKLFSSHYVLIGFWFAVTFISLELNFVSSNTIIGWLRSSESERKFVFSLLLFSSMFLKMTPGTLHIKTLLSHSLQLLWIRASVAIAYVGFTYNYFNTALLAAIILISMPPSSMLPSIVGKLQGLEMEGNRINQIVISFNLLFLIALLIAIAIQMGSNWLHTETLL
jgi:hypothetical protein